MTDHAELIERLRALVDRRAPWTHVSAVSAMSDASTALAALVAERDRYREALGATIALDDLLERRRTRENPEVRRIKMPDESVAEGPVVDLFYEVLDAIKAAAERARAALAQGGGQ